VKKNINQRLLNNYFDHYQKEHLLDAAMNRKGEQEVKRTNSGGNAAT
jgi:hypothetical protein